MRDEAKRKADDKLDSLFILFLRNIKVLSGEVSRNILYACNGFFACPV
jgi:hypothetical protein